MRHSTTRELLGATYQETIDTPLSSAPRPLQSNEYDEDRVRESLRFADETIRNPTRTLAPIGIQAVRLYKETCARYLSLGEPDAKKEYIAAMIVMEKAFSFHLFLQNTNIQQDDKLLQDELVRLYRSQFYARYGEYLLDFCGELGMEAEMQKFTGWDKVQKSYWIEIGGKIDSEKDSWFAYKTGNMDAYKKCPIHKTLFHTSMKIGLDFKGTLEAIMHYARRNEPLHGNLFQMLRGGYYDKRKTLYADLCDIPKITDLCEDNCGSLLRLTLETLINEWHNIDSMDEDNIQAWIPKSSLVKLRKGLGKVGSENKNTELSKKVTNHMVQAMKETLRERKMEKEMEQEMEELVLVGGPMTQQDGNRGSQSQLGRELEELILAKGLMTIQDGKLVPQSQLGKEIELAKRMERSWGALMKIGCGLRKRKDEGLEDFQVVTGAPELIVDPV